MLKFKEVWLIRDLWLSAFFSALVASWSRNLSDLFWPTWQNKSLGASVAFVSERGVRWPQFNTTCWTTRSI